MNKATQSQEQSKNLSSISSSAPETATRSHASVDGRCRTKPSASIKSVVGGAEVIQDRLQAIICFCHLRWDFVYQRPQHLLTRCHALVDVHLWEEPVFTDTDIPFLRTSIGKGGVCVLTPELPHGSQGNASTVIQRYLLDAYLSEQNITDFIAWYYTPMALPFSCHLKPEVVVYDCMDELSGFQGAPPELVEQERMLFHRADVVFTGGASLFGSKRNQHPNVHLFPSAIDREHFAVARHPQEDPADQASIPHPQIGFFGVLDERLDCALLRDVSEQHPEWNFVLIGPVVKIGNEALPHSANIHYLGQKDYAELPGYLANWDVAMLPFALNQSTRYISPTKTPEYLAAGKPVVSTPIRDVVSTYGDRGMVMIGATAREFSSAVQTCLEVKNRERWLARVDTFLAGISWDITFTQMWKEIARCYSRRAQSLELVDSPEVAVDLKAVAREEIKREAA